MILVDTSVWIDHLHRSVPRLVEVLEAAEVVSHPFIIGELACGMLRRRHEVLGLLGALPMTTPATHEEALDLIESQELMGSGIGIVDVHLIGSVMLTPGCVLWTRDKRLRPVVQRLRIDFAER